MNDSLSRWLQLVTAAAQGDPAAQAALQATTLLSTPDEWQQWFNRYLPGVTGTPADEWTESWWRLSGVVPRVRYLALERENQQLREQVAAAEAANALLRSQLLASAPAVQAGKGVQNMLDEMARAQAQWLDAWRAHSGGGEDK
jgi:hypothetical protein